MTTLTVSLVIPFHNAAKELERGLQLCVEAQSKFPCELEVIFVNDGSTDHSLRLAAQYEHKGITIMTYSESRGLGYATRLGVQAAKGQAIAVTSVSIPYQLDALTDGIIALSEEEADAAFGSRLCSTAGISFFKKLSLVKRCWKIGEYLPIHVKDPLSMFYLFSENAARKLFPFCVVDNSFYPLELLGLAAKKDLKIVDIPVHCRGVVHILKEEAEFKKSLLENLKKIRARLRFDEFY